MRDDDDEREVEEMNTYLQGCEDEDDEEECDAMQRRRLEDESMSG
jgi:hypothetical protein